MNQIQIHISKEHADQTENIRKAFGDLPVRVSADHWRLSEGELAMHITIEIGKWIIAGISWDLLKAAIKKLRTNYPAAGIAIRDKQSIMYGIGPDETVAVIVIPDRKQEFAHIKTLEDLLQHLKSDWQQLKIYEAFYFIRTCSHSKDKMSYGQGREESIYNIHYGDIHARYSDYVDFKKEKVPFLLDTEEAISEDKFLRDGDLVMVDASEDYDGVGSAIEIKNLENKKCIAGLHVFALRDKSNKTVNGYRKLALSHPEVLKRLKQVSTYSKVYGISKGSFSSINLFLPPLPEQKRIVAVLETWDKAIDALEKKIELKEQLKKGLMQQLLTGKKRLPGFSGEWAKTELLNLLFISKEKVQANNMPNNLKCIDLQNIDSGTGTINSFQFACESKSTKNVFVKGDILFGKLRPYLRKFWSATFLGVCSTEIWVLKPSKRLMNDFLYLLVQTDRFNALANTSSGSRMPRADWKFMKEQAVLYPNSRTEQEAIAKLFKLADEEIRYLASKLVKYKEQKKYLLNNLVTGKIRTPEDMKITEHA